MGHHGRESAATKAAVARHHRALELHDTGKDFFGGYAYMSQGPLPLVWAGTQIGQARALGPAR